MLDCTRTENFNRSQHWKTEILQQKSLGISSKSVWSIKNDFSTFSLLFIFIFIIQCDFRNHHSNYSAVICSSGSDQCQSVHLSVHVTHLYGSKDYHLFMGPSGKLSIRAIGAIGTGPYFQRAPKTFRPHLLFQYSCHFSHAFSYSLNIFFENC